VSEAISSSIALACLETVVHHPALLEIPARTSGESRPEEVQLYEQF
jgi:hypothetical protein